MYDSRKGTKKHIKRVQELLSKVEFKLKDLGIDHDSSKLESPEKDYFDEYSPKLKDTTYGSQEYHQFLEEMEPALDHHYKNNRHHIQFHENGIEDMDIIDLMEMLCDWKAASERHNDGDIYKSLEINKERFKIPDHTYNLLYRTVQRLGW